MASTIDGHMVNILQQKSVLDSLILQASEKTTTSTLIGLSKNQWIFHKDDIFVNPAIPFVQTLTDPTRYMGLASKVGDSVGDISQLESVDSVTTIFERMEEFREHLINSSITTAKNSTTTTNDIPFSWDWSRKAWFAFTPPVETFPQTLTAPAMSIDSVKKLLGEETLIISICSYEGYNFTSEYTLVYKGSFSSVRAYDDTLAVLGKALKSVEPSLTPDQITNYSGYIMKRALWEYFLYLEVFRATFQGHFPGIDGLNLVKNLPINHMRVFVGKHRHITPSTTTSSSDALQEGKLSFTIRLEDEIVLQDSINKMVTENLLVKLIYYHDYPLTGNSNSQRIMNFFTELMMHRDLTSMQSLIGSHPDFKRFIDESNKACRFYLVFPTFTLLSKDDALAVIEQRQREQEQQQQGQGADTQTVSSHEQSEKEKARRLKAIEAAEHELSLDASTHPPHVSAASLCSELYGWGYDSYYSLGLGGQVRRQLALGDERDEVFDPRPVTISRTITVERVRMIACSSRHSLLLTHFGTLYGCGDNADGALGCGDLVTR